METATSVVETAAGPGLRERKKRRTRDALLRSALELFAVQGYEGTTVDEIADAVDVSQRTFFRYFANKEETVFAVAEMAEEHFVRTLRARPPGEAPLEALRRAALESWDTIGETVGSVVPVDVLMRTCQLIESTPVLFAAHLRRSMELEERVARLIAEREGLDAATDPRPRVAVALFGGVLRATERLWSTGEDLSVAAIRRLTTEHLDAVAPALTGGWREHAR
ncbi:TetR family transcriptional regulator [Streptomyces minutiscleroticus]|uniref:TetR family transcriptional regulator n=1 Tax=Streptomyces minutiscleroticus TaxID=68238 RepID=A0A918K8B8_9ACTN|nr:TetR family transcriptional regulator [Streptomyces minutiscleroticus]GGX52189.1 TetR family transcriptional regulator [Streptomyces minutiscleroticus]